MKSRKSLSTILRTAGEHGIENQRHDGAMPAGHNGPYHDPETPVRNTAHWLFLFADLYNKTGAEKWKIGANKAITFLKNTTARPDGYTFHCRDKAGKDRCNGLIGQAWSIEALAKAVEVFNRNDCYKLAEEIFLLHPWDKTVNLWKRVSIEGDIMAESTI